MFKEVMAMLKWVVFYTAGWCGGLVILSFLVAVFFKLLFSW
jgi:hypothetical protein